MNAFRSIGTKIVTAVMATGLAAGAAFAATSGYTVTVTLPEAVTVGNTSLSGGQYTITESPLADGTKMFVFRSEKGEALVALATKNAEPAADQKTEVVLSHENGNLHLDKLFIEGDSAGYQFAESK
jgi:hypothetical protein